MSTDANVESVRHAFDAVGRGDVAAFVGLLAADVVYTLIGTTASRPW